MYTETDGNSPRYATCNQNQNHLRELYVSRVAGDAAIRVLVARVADELRVPYLEVMPPVCPLWKHSDSRPETRTRGVVNGHSDIFTNFQE